MGDDGLGPKGRLALAAALGTGVVIGAAGLVVYQVSFFFVNSFDPYLTCHPANESERGSQSNWSGLLSGVGNSDNPHCCPKGRLGTVERKQ